ncbi:MAG: replication initiation protein, partial [Senegalia sp. (in: firmicutes)]
KLNLNEQKIILYAVSKIDKSKEDFNIIEIDVKDFFSLLHTSTERYTELREIVRVLRGKEVIINTVEGEIISGWLSSIEYKKDKGIIELEFSKKLIPYLLQLKKKFTRYKLENILYLKNKYSIRLYELLKQYENISKRTFTINELKEVLMIDSSSYKRFANLEQRILQPTLKEINELTDIRVNYEKIKKGRRIDKLLYSIQSKEVFEKQYLLHLKENFNTEDIKRLSGLEGENFNPKQIIELYEIAVAKTDTDEYVDVFEYIKLNYKNMIEHNRARNKFSYLKKALNEDYAAARGQIKLFNLVENKKAF